MIETAVTIAQWIWENRPVIGIGVLVLAYVAATLVMNDWAHTRTR
jgi:hypothetical protein